MKMRFYGVVCIFLLVVIAFTGCGNGNDSGPIQQNAIEETASIKLQIISAEEKASVKASNSENPVSVTCIIRLLKPEDPAKFDELRKTAIVSNGSADFFFTSIPARSATIRLAITGGKIGDYAEFRGAKDLTAGENIISIAGIGSNLEPDAIAAAVDTLSANGSLTSNFENNLIANVRSAYVITKNTTGTKIPDFIENVAQVYLAKRASALPEQSKVSDHLNQFILTSTKVLPARLSEFKANIAPGLRAATNAWSWDATAKWWEYYTYSTGFSALEVFYFLDNARNQYKTINDSPDINGIGIGLSLTLKTISGTIKYNEIHDFKAISASNYEVSGLVTSSLDNIQYLKASTFKVLVDLQKSYPTSGKFTVTLTGVGKFEIIFNGTCVGDVFFTDLAGLTTQTKIIMTPDPVHSGTVFEASCRASVVETGNTAIDLRQEMLKHASQWANSRH